MNFQIILMPKVILSKFLSTHLDHSYIKYALILLNSEDSISRYLIINLNAIYDVISIKNSIKLIADNKVQ